MDFKFTELRCEVSASLGGAMFYLLPVISILKAVLSIVDIATDMVVMLKWWLMGRDYWVWASVALAILVLSWSVSVYRGYFLSHERATLDIWGLDTKERTALRLLLLGLQLQYIIMTILFMRLWLRAIKLKRDLRMGFLPKPTRMMNKIVPAGSIKVVPAGSIFKTQDDHKNLVELDKLLKEMDTLANDGSWWLCYKTLFQSWPQLCLQAYVMFLTRNFGVIDVFSCAMSIAAISHSMVGVFNNPHIGETWYSIKVVEPGLRQVCMCAFFVGSVGMRTSAIAFVLVAFSWWASLYCVFLCISNFIAMMFFVYVPTKKEVDAMACSIFDDWMYQYYLGDQRHCFFWLWGYACGYGLGNFLGPSLGHAAWGWKWKHRKLMVPINVAYRGVENVLGILLVLLLENQSPCDPASGLHYQDNGCRGPIYMPEVVGITCSFAIVYAVAFVIWWPGQLNHLSTALGWVLVRRPVASPANQSSSVPPSTIKCGLTTDVTVGS